MELRWTTCKISDVNDSSWSIPKCLFVLNSALILCSHPGRRKWSGKKRLVFPVNFQCEKTNQVVIKWTGIGHQGMSGWNRHSCSCSSASSSGCCCLRNVRHQATGITVMHKRRKFFVLTLVLFSWARRAGYFPFLDTNQPSVASYFPDICRNLYCFRSQYGTLTFFWTRAWSVQ